MENFGILDTVSCRLMLLMGGAGGLQEVFVFDCILVWNFVST